MIEASEVELVVQQPKVESLRNTIGYLNGIMANIETEIMQAEVDDRIFTDPIEYVSVVKAVITNKHDDQDFKQRSRNHFFVNRSKSSIPKRLKD